MAKNWNPSWASDVGVNNVPSYQVSGRPFAYHQTMSAATKTQVQFPYVSRWVYIVNNGSSDVKVAFSSNGLNSGNANFFVVPKGNGTSGIGLHRPQLVRLVRGKFGPWQSLAGHM